MARHGMGVGVTEDTVLFLPFHRGYLEDRSGSALTVTAQNAGGTTLAAGSCAEGYLAPGLYGEALQFGSSGSVLSRVEVASAAAINVTGELTLDVEFRSTDPGNERTLIARPGAWILAVSGSGLTLTLTDSVAATETFTLPIAMGRGVASRWHSLRVAVSIAGGWVRAWWDGSLVLYKTIATVIDIASTGLNALQVGAHTATGGAGAAVSQWSGQIGRVRVQDVAENDLSTLAANLSADRITRRQVTIAHLDCPQQLQDETWTADGGGGYWLALSAFTAGSLIVSPLDIVSVKSKTAAGVETTYSETGNISLVDATSLTWWLDLANSKLYVHGDPSAATIFEVMVRLPLADHGLARGFRWYHPAILSWKAERRTAHLDEPFSTGSGGSLELAAAYVGFPAGLWSEETSAIPLTGARVYIAGTSDDRPWSSLTPLFVGILDSEPDAGRDVVALKLAHEMARLYKLPMAAKALDTATYPYIYQPDEGKVPNTLVGYSLLRVPCYCIDSRYQAGLGGYQYIFGANPVARIKRIGKGATAFSTTLSNIDLTNCTFYSLAVPTGGPYWVDVDGLGTPSPATYSSSTLPCGNSSDIALGIIPILQRWLGLKLGLTASDYDATWSATEARAEIVLRRSEPMPSASAFIDYLQQTLLASYLFLYVKPSTEWQPALWCCEDVVQADAADATLADADVISEEILVDRERIVSRLEVDALAYWVDSYGNLKDSKSVASDLDVGARYSKAIGSVWRGGVLGHTSDTEASAFLTTITPLKDSPAYRYKATLPMRSVGLEQLSKATVSSTLIPSGLGTGFRAQSVAVGSDGVVEVLTFPEAPLPADGTTAAPSRSPMGPAQRFRASFPGGQSCATTGAWTRVGTFQHPMQGGWALMHSTMAHTLLVRAQRSGGAADTDFKVRLYDATNAQVIATLTSGVSTTLGYFTDTTFSNIPTGNAELEVQYYATAGVSGTVHDVSWWAKETAGVGLFDPLPPTLIYGYGVSSGLALSTELTNLGTSNYPVSAPAYSGYIKHPSGGTIGLSCPASLTTGTTQRLIIRADGTGASGLYIGLAQVLNDVPLTAMWSLYPYAAISGGLAYYVTSAFQVTAGSHYVVAAVATTLGSAKFYSIGWECHSDLPVS